MGDVGLNDVDSSSLKTIRSSLSDEERYVRTGKVDVLGPEVLPRVEPLPESDGDPRRLRDVGDLVDVASHYERFTQLSRAKERGTAA